MKSITDFIKESIDIKHLAVEKWDSNDLKSFFESIGIPSEDVYNGRKQ